MGIVIAHAYRDGKASARCVGHSGNPTGRYRNAAVDLADCGRALGSEH
jgi:hypothetical protein